MNRQITLVFELHQLVQNASIIPKRTIFSSKYGPKRLVRFETHQNSFCVILESENGDHNRYCNVELRKLNLKIQGEPEKTMVPFEEAP